MRRSFRSHSHLRHTYPPTVWLLAPNEEFTYGCTLCVLSLFTPRPLVCSLNFKTHPGPLHKTSINCLLTSEAPLLRYIYTVTSHSHPSRQSAHFLQLDYCARRFAHGCLTNHWTHYDSYDLSMPVAKPLRCAKLMTIKLKNLR